MQNGPINWEVLDYGKKGVPYRVRFTAMPLELRGRSTSDTPLLVRGQYSLWSNQYPSFVSWDDKHGLCLPGKKEHRDTKEVHIPQEHLHNILDLVIEFNKMYRPEFTESVAVDPIMLGATADILKPLTEVLQ